jgi:hypothetical protein
MFLRTLFWQTLYLKDVCKYVPCLPYVKVKAFIEVPVFSNNAIAPITFFESGH